MLYRYIAVAQEEIVQKYLDLLQKVIDNGEEIDDRTGVGTVGIFGEQMRFDLSKGLPILTTKKIHLKSIIHELLWFLSGDTNIKYLKDNKVKIWDEWADENGELGPVYGHQWRSWPTPDGEKIDQIAGLMKDLKGNPHSRRHIVTAWNVSDIPKMKLPPCHCLFQFNVSPSGKLSCHLYQRSADIFLGVPFNITSYSLLTMMIAQCLDLQPGDFIHSFGDLHLYKNHFDQAYEQLQRKPKRLPKMIINEVQKDIFTFRENDFKLIGYDPYPNIKAPVAV